MKRKPLKISIIVLIIGGPFINFFSNKKILCKLDKNLVRPKDIDLQIFKKEAEESLQKFDKIQKEAVGDIDSFMHSYNKQI